MWKYPAAATNQMARSLVGEAREPVRCTRGKVPKGDGKKEEEKMDWKKGKEGRTEQ